MKSYITAPGTKKNILKKHAHATTSKSLRPERALSSASSRSVILNFRVASKVFQLSPLSNTSDKDVHASSPISLAKNKTLDKLRSLLGERL